MWSCRIPNLEVTGTGVYKKSYSREVGVILLGKWRCASAPSSLSWHWPVSTVTWPFTQQEIPTKKDNLRKKPSLSSMLSKKKKAFLMVSAQTYVPRHAHLYRYSWVMAQWRKDSSSLMDSLVFRCMRKPALHRFLQRYRYFGPGFGSVSLYECWWYVAPFGLKCIIDVSYGVALLFWTRGGGWTGWSERGGYGLAMGCPNFEFL